MTDTPHVSKEAIQRVAASLAVSGLHEAVSTLLATASERDALLLAHPACPTCGKPAVSNGVTGYCPHCQLVAATERAEKAEARLVPGGLTERAPTVAAYEAACRAIEKHRARVAALTKALHVADAEFASLGYSIMTVGMDEGKPRETILRALSAPPAPASVNDPLTVGAVKEPLTTSAPSQAAADETAGSGWTVTSGADLQIRGTDIAASQNAADRVRAELERLERLDRAAAGDEREG